MHLVRAAFPTEPADPAAWPACARLLPHVLAVTGHATALSIDLETTAWLLAEAGAYLFERADYPQARTLHERAVAIREACLGPDHPDTAHSLQISPSSCASRTTLTPPTPCLSAPFQSARPTWGPTIPTPPGASTVSPSSCVGKATSTAPIGLVDFADIGPRAEPLRSSARRVSAESTHGATNAD